jgi:hypothetical protein
VTGVWRGRALAGVLRQSDQSEKTWLCCYREPTSPGTESVYRQLLPGLLLWQPSQWKEEARGRSPCFVWKLSQWNVACRIWRQWQPQNMVDLSSSGVGNSKHTASLSYHAPWLNCPQAFVQLGYGTHLAEQALFMSLWCMSCPEFRVAPWTQNVMVW